MVLSYQIEFHAHDRRKFQSVVQNLNIPAFPKIIYCDRIFENYVMRSLTLCGP
jgi:hypothetical protein